MTNQEKWEVFTGLPVEKGRIGKHRDGEDTSGLVRVLDRRVKVTGDVVLNFISVEDIEMRSVEYKEAQILIKS